MKHCATQHKNMFFNNVITVITGVKPAGNTPNLQTKHPDAGYTNGAGKTPILKKHKTLDFGIFM